MGEAIGHPLADVVVVALLGDGRSISRNILADFAPGEGEDWRTRRLGHLCQMKLVQRTFIRIRGIVVSCRKRGLPYEVVSWI